MLTSPFVSNGDAVLTSLDGEGLRSQGSLTNRSDTGNPILQSLIDDAGHKDAHSLGVPLDFPSGCAAALQEARVANGNCFLWQGSVRVHVIFHKANFRCQRLSHLGYFRNGIDRTSLKFVTRG